MRPRQIFTLTLAAFVLPLHSLVEASEISDNETLTAIFEADQADRAAGFQEVDWDQVNARDADRRLRTLEVLRRGTVRTAADFLHAAYVFQHGNTVEDLRLALSLAWVAATIDPTDEEARWLTASAWDRLLKAQDQPQWYGTQIEKFGDSPWQIYEIQAGVITDEDRKHMGVPPLDELLRGIAEMNNE